MSRFILLHAFPLDSRMWVPVADLLRGAGHEVLLVDLGGLGESQIPAAEPSVDVLATQAVEALDARGWDRAHVTGISMGGYVALAMLRLYPEHVANLGLISTKASMDSPAKRAERLDQATSMDASAVAVLARSMSVSLLASDTQGSASLVAESAASQSAQVSSWIGSQAPKAIAWCLRAMATRPDSLGTLRTAGWRRVAIVCGEADAITTSDDARQMLAACLDAGAKPELHLLPEIGHLSAVQAPAAVAAALASLADS